MARITKTIVPPEVLAPPRLTPAEPFVFPKPERFKLKCGLPVFLLEKHDLPQVAARFVFFSGQDQDPVELEGTAFFAGHLALEGAGHRSAMQFATDLHQIGATIYSRAYEENSFFLLKTLTPHLSLGFDLFTDVLLHPRHQAHEFKRQQAELIDYARSRRVHADRVCALALRAALFGELHPYGQPLLPTPEAMMKLRREEISAFHHAHFVPGNGALIVAGDIDSVQLTSLLEPRLRHWKNPASLPHRPRLPKLPRQVPRLVLVDFPGATQANIRVGHHAPRRLNPDFAALQTLNIILGGSFTSRLNLNLREKNGFTYGAHSNFSLRRVAGQLTIGTAVETINTVSAVVEILTELKKLKQQQVKKDELSKAQSLLIDNFPATCETNDGLAELFCSVLEQNLPLNTPSTLPAQILRLKPADLHRCAHQYLQPEQATIVVAGDLAAIGPALIKKFGPAQYRNTDGALLPAPR